MIEENETPEFSFPVELSTLTKAGKVYKLTINGEDRSKVAERLGVISLFEFSASVRLRAESKKMFQVIGALNATLERECVASLEPMNEKVEDKFDVSFLRTDQDLGIVGTDEGEQWEGEEVPLELCVGDSFDLGEFLVQQLALAMDPFPRKSGAVSLVETYGGSGEISPFAELAEKIKKSDINQ